MWRAEKHLRTNKPPKNLEGLQQQKTKLGLSPVSQEQESIQAMVGITISGQLVQTD